MCEFLSQEGHRVYGTSRKGDGIQLIPMDVTDEASVREAIKTVMEREGKIDVLINNAGISSAGPLEETSLAEAKSIFETNVFGLLSVTKACLPEIRKSKGYIINISSIAGEIALPYRGIYSASKFAVEALTESLSMETSPFGVKVLLIQPGDLNTNINQNRTVTPVNAQSPYHESFQRHLADIESHMSQSMDPSVIGKLIVTILKEPNPKLKYQVGPALQKLSTRIKKILPPRMFEKILKKHYQLD